MIAVTMTDEARVTGRAVTSDHAGDRQTFEVYGHRITHTSDPEVQQLLAAAHTHRIRPGARAAPTASPCTSPRSGPRGTSSNACPTPASSTRRVAPPTCR